MLSPTWYSFPAGHICSHPSTTHQLLSGSKSGVIFCPLIIGIAFICSWNIGYAWADSLESALMPGQVFQGHAKWEEDCARCHKRFNKTAQTQLCQECHKDVREDIDRKQKFHGRLTEHRECKDCHTDHKGRGANIAPINELTFDHSHTNFVLNGAHADSKKTDCKACHKPKVRYRDTPSECLACHRKDDTHKGNFGEKCVACHTENNWKEIAFNHDRDTKYPLIDKHKSVKCESCHTGHLVKDKLKTDCVSCHKKDDYHKGVFGPKCETCHSEKSWKTSPFNHDKETKYPLLGKHKTSKCESCHKVPVAKEKTPTPCYACHKKDDKHEGALGRTCESCHTEKEWKDIPSFDHDKTTFPLLGKHQAAKCTDCHSDQRYKLTPKDCYSCHKKDDVHKGALGKACETCHAENKWMDIDHFDHENTKFRLRGGHILARCKDCHSDQLYRPTPIECNACHKKDDSHKGRFGEQCEACHTDQRWKEIVFNHDRQTKYPLRDKHKGLTCESCHKGHLYLYKDKTPTACYACHRKEDTHNGVFGEGCSTCHNEKGWKLSSFDHERDTKYMLLGRHMEVKCEDCHIVPSTKGKTPTTCVACHKKEDLHKGQYGDRCESCHIARSWKHSVFDHDRDTKYILRDTHRSVRCQGCHKGHLYEDKTPTSCQSCHRKDDVHKGQFGDRCEACHTERKWKSVLFGHDRLTKFPLRGRHIVITCESCHTGHLYKDKLKTDCYSCHKKEDKHKGQEGPKCEACHSEDRWREVVFDHETSAFPLRGAHDIAPCRKCHQALTFKDAPSACIACHEKEDIHKRRLGTDCQACHNARDWKLWEFDHNTRTSFILDGAHVPLDCYACHKKPLRGKVTISSACVGCHKNDDKHEGGFGPQCDRCHVTALWKTIKTGSGAFRDR